MKRPRYVRANAEVREQQTLERALLEAWGAADRADRAAGISGNPETEKLWKALQRQSLATKAAIRRQVGGNY